MIEAQIKSPNGRIIVKVSADKPLDLMEQIAMAQEILDADSACGACGSANIRYRVRPQGKFRYPEMHCDQCRADLSFGQRKEDGVVYPKRFTEDHLPIPNRGWVVFVPEPGRRK